MFKCGVVVLEYLEVFWFLLLTLPLLTELESSGLDYSLLCLVRLIFHFSDLF